MDPAVSTRTILGTILSCGVLSASYVSSPINYATSIRRISEGDSRFFMANEKDITVSAVLGKTLTTFNPKTPLGKKLWEIRNKAKAAGYEFASASTIISELRAERES